MRPEDIGGQPWPSIYFMDSVPQKDDFGAAAGMGFNVLGLSYLSDRDLPGVVKEAQDRGLSVVLDLNILTAQEDDGLVSSRPDRSVPADGLGRFIDLVETDPAVDWWDTKIAGWQAAGVVGFRCLDIGRVNAAIWRRLIEGAKSRAAATRFFAWTPGLDIAVIKSVVSAGFDHSFSSSCWWDFKAAWLSEDAERMALIGPEIALAAAPNKKWPVGLNERKRAVIFAATYSAGWLMPAGFQDDGLVDEVTQLNKWRAENPALQCKRSASVVSSAGSEIAVLRRGGDLALAINASANSNAEFEASTIAWRIGGQLQRIGDGRVLESLNLAGGEILICEISQTKPIVSSKRLDVDCDAPRISVEVTTPKVDAGQFPVRRLVGERVSIAADIICDGHDKLAADVLWRPVDEAVWKCSPMVLVANDRWQGDITLDRLGSYVFAVRAWKDFYATFVDEVTKKHLAGVSIHLEMKEGLALIRAAAKAAGKKNGKGLLSYIEKIDQADDDGKLPLLVSDELVELMRQNDIRHFAVQSDAVRLDAERLGARFSSWYEIFPRSQSGDGVRHGTFQDVIHQLPRISSMGFDVLYFPPIHPIGRRNRKGRNNTLTPAIDDPGSPYAIGSTEGGHDAVHPELGTIQDFDALREAAASHGIELALDFAVQCAPDHPWLKEHKEWFDWRPDGSIRYAENPPKKYEDIVNVDFYAEGAKPSLWLALRDIVQFWVDHGVRLFRVDNPHTKPFPFWEWLIADIRSRHPDVLFLAEAFTRPKIMYRLAKIGFSQSYTYFTWRNTKAEIIEYLTELNETEVRDYFRPHFFVNTPDINPFFLQNARRSAFLIRAALAATLSGLWGVYNGFELCEATPFAPGKEEYLDSEKYQLRAWNHKRTGNIVAEVTKLNSIRRSNAALQSHLGLRFHATDDENVICYSKSAPDGNFVFVVVSLDIDLNKDVRIEVPLWLFDLPDDGAIACEDLMRDFSFVWQGKSQYVNLHPGSPFCIWRLRRVGAR
jgi:starch synthase (maltosyl-transferring)